MEIKLPDEFAKKLSTLGQRTDEITAKVLEAGAETIRPVLQENLRGVIGKDLNFDSRSTGELVESVGVSSAKLDKNGNMDVKIGFREPRKKATVKGKAIYNAMVANVIENGKHGQPPRPFIKRTIMQSKKACLAAIEKKFDEEVKKL